MHDGAAEIRVTEIIVEQRRVVVGRIAEPGSRPKVVGDVVDTLTEAGHRGMPERIRRLEIERAGLDFRLHQGFVLVIENVRRAGLRRIAQILIVAVGGAAIEIEDARHPVERSAGLRAQVEFLRHRIVLVQHELVVLAAVEVGRQRNGEAAFRIRAALIHVLDARQRLESHRGEIIGRDDGGDGLIDVVDTRPIAGLVPGVRVRIQDVLALRLMLDDLRIFEAPDDREILNRLEQRRHAQVIVVRVVEVVVAGYLGRHHIAVLLDEVAGKTDRKGARERQIDRRAQVRQIEGAELHVGVSLDRVEGRQNGNDVERAADRVLSEYGALRPAQHLDVVDVQKAQAQGERVRDEYSVLMNGDRPRGAVVLGRVQSDAANGEIEVVAVALADDEAGNHAIQILGAPDLVLLENFRRQGGDRLRRSLDPLVLFLSDDDDAFELVRRSGIRRHSHHGREKNPTHDPRYSLVPRPHSNIPFLVLKAARHHF